MLKFTNRSIEDLNSSVEPRFSNVLNFINEIIENYEKKN